MTGSERQNGNPRSRRGAAFAGGPHNKVLVTLGTATMVYVVVNGLCAVMSVRNLDLLNSIVVPPLTLGIVVLTVVLRRQMAAGTASRTLWTGMAVGAAAWAIAELMWLFSVIRGWEVAWPSVADIFWLAAYVPMVGALSIRIRSLPRNPDRRWQAAMWALSLLSVVLVAGFVVLPSIQTYDPAYLLGSILNILYPLFDLILLLMTLWILSAYQEGNYGQGWVWISAGFVLIALSDLFFAYSSTVGSYYPDGRANLMSVMVVDIPYTLGYLSWLVGLLLLRDLLGRHRRLVVDEERLELVSNTHLFFPIKADGSVILASRNAPAILTIDDQCIGRPLWQVLGMEQELFSVMLATLRANGMLDERSIAVMTRSGLREARCSGIAVLDAQGDYTGASLLVRMVAQDEALDELLTAYQLSMVRHIGQVTGALREEEEEIKRLLAGYYLAYIRALYNRGLTEGGPVMADALQAELLGVVRKCGWQVKPHPQTLLDLSALSLPAIQEALPQLVQVCKSFVAQITDESTAMAVIEDVESQIDAAIHKNVRGHSRRFQAAEPAGA